MTCGDSRTTVICDPDFRLPAAYAFARNTCTADMTSAGWVEYASPKAEVQLRLLASVFSTDGNCVSAFTLGSQVWTSTTAMRLCPAILGFCCKNWFADAIWSGKVAAPRIWATSASGYSAMGATNCRKSSGDSGAPRPEYPDC